MMKLFVYVPIAFVAVSVADAGLLRNKIDDDFHRKLVSCLGNQDFNLSATACDYSSVVAALETKLAGTGCSNGAALELQLLLDATDATEAKAAIAGLCTAAVDIMPFKDINLEGDLFDKEFFDGNKWLNDQRQTKDKYGVDINILQSDAYRIKETFDGPAKDRIISFPDHLPNFEACESTAVMCCWIQDRQAESPAKIGGCDVDYDVNCVNAEPVDNTDICYVDMSRSPQANHVAAGFAIFDGAGDDEGASYCHGFAWSSDPSKAGSRYKGNALFHVSMYSNLYSKGFVRNVPGAPMCGCVEQMPVATKSACTQVNVVESGVKFSFSDGKLSAGVDSVTVDYKDCANDAGVSLSLGPYYKSLVDKNLASGSLDATLVGDGNCATAVGSFLQTQSLKRA